MASMCMMIKRHHKKHKYPPEGMEDVVQTVMQQCELWTGNEDMLSDRAAVYAERLVQYRH